MSTNPTHFRTLVILVCFIACGAGWASTTAIGADIRRGVAYNGERQLRIDGDRTVPTHVEVESAETRFGVYVRVRLTNLRNNDMTVEAFRKDSIDRVVISTGVYGDIIENWTTIDADIYSGAGNDMITSGLGDDFVYADRGNDYIEGLTGDDFLYGGWGDDTIYGNNGGAYWYGLEGDKTIEGGPGNDTLYGAGGQDTIRGGTGNDHINGRSGDDEIHGDVGEDELDGGYGNDWIAGGEGTDLIDGGVGRDTLIIDYSDILAELSAWEVLSVRLFFVQHVDRGEYRGSIIVYPWRYED